MKVYRLALVVAGVLGLSGCGGGSATQPSSTTSNAASTTTPPPSSVAATTVATTTAPTTIAPTTIAPTTTAPTVSTSPVLGFCPPGQLRATYTGDNGAAGTAFYGFDVTNVGTEGCPVGGYFGVSLYDQAGHLLTTTDTRETGFNPVVPVQLAPGATASFVVSASETPVNALTCLLIGAFHLIPPDATTDLQVSVPATDNLLYCDNHGVGVRPTAPGASSIQQ